MASSEDNTFEKNAEEIAQGLQRMAEDEIIYELRRSTMTTLSRRKTIRELTENARGPSMRLGNLERLFRRKLHNPDVSGMYSSYFPFVKNLDSLHIGIYMSILSPLISICIYFYILSLSKHLVYVGLSEHVSSRISKDTFSAFERRRSTILARRKKTQAQKPYDIYDDANNLRPSNNQAYQSQVKWSDSMVNQFQYDNPTFRQDENI